MPVIHAIDSAQRLCGLIVCGTSTTDYNYTEELDENAFPELVRLYAAAPEMLEALRQSRSALSIAFDRGCNFGIHHNDAVDALSAIELAIARATRAQP